MISVSSKTNFGRKHTQQETYDICWTVPFQLLLNSISMCVSSLPRYNSMYIYIYIGVLQKTNVIYKFKCPLGDCISDNNNIYVGLTSTTLSRRLTMHLSDTSSIAQHLKEHSCPTAQLRKILTDNTTILEHQNNKQKLQILEALHIRNLQPTLNRINFQTSANVLKCL